MAELFRARSLVLSCQTAEALKNALDGASEFQFMDKGHLMQDALKKYEFPVGFSFVTVASGLTELSGSLPLGWPRISPRRRLSS